LPFIPCASAHDAIAADAPKLSGTTVAPESPFPAVKEQLAPGARWLRLDKIPQQPRDSTRARLLGKKLLLISVL
jgi:hypothetical protein